MILLAALALTVSGCSSGPGIEGNWQLSSGEMDGRPIPLVPDHRITLTVSGAEFGGRSACNHYGAEVSYGGRSLLGGVAVEVSSVSMTAMACEPNVMASESAYHEALMRVDSASRSGRRLTLSGPNVRLEYEELAPVAQSSMTATRWALDAVIEGEVAAAPLGDRALLELDADGSLRGSTGCRTLTGTYIISGDEVVTTSLAADGECPAHLAAQDGHVVSVIGDGFRVRVEGQVMTLESTGGQGLVYRAED